MIVEVASLHRSFADRHVLHDLSLAVPEGDFLAIVGTSGSGKSTLLHVLAGLDRGFSGRVRVAGHDFHSLSDRELSRFRNRKVGLVFQAFHLLDHLTCLENVMLPAWFGDGSGGDPAARAAEVLARVGLSGRAGDRPARLSGGEKQRVAIARALFCRPALLLCDEPTGNLDAETGAAIIDLFRDIHRDGVTVLVVTHEERVVSAASRALRLAGGALAPFGPQP